MKKKIVCLFLVTLLVFTIAGCGSDPEDKDSSIGAADNDTKQENIDDNQEKQLEGDEESERVAAVVYYPSSDGLSLTKEEIEVETAEDLTMNDVWNQLQKYDVVPASLMHSDIKEHTDENGGLVLTLDVPESFTEHLKGLDIDSETLLIQAIVNTIADNFKAEAVIITADGETLVTENGSYGDPIEFKDLEADDETEINIGEAEVEDETEAEQ